MGKNKVIYRHVILLLILFLSSCNSDNIENGYYRYWLGEIRIDNPILVSFHNLYGKDFIDPAETAFVCPDSIIYCCLDSNWRRRDDVYPYIAFLDEPGDLQPSYRNKTFNIRRLFEKFIPYYPFETTDDTDTTTCEVSFYKFHYNLNTFDAYMQAVDGYFYDPSDPNFEDAEADCYNAFAYSNRYRIAVRHHYSLWQIIKLGKKYVRQRQIFDREMQSINIVD